MPPLVLLRFKRFSLLLLLLIWVLPYVGLSRGRATPPDSCWQPGFGMPEGPDGEVLAMAWARGSLYVGGRFTAAGGVAARNVARWDGRHWHSLGTGVDNGVGYTPGKSRSPDGQLAAVHALVVGPQGEVYVGGEFNQAGRVAVPDLACWDGHQWRAVGDFRHLEDSIQRHRDAQKARQWTPPPVPDTPLWPLTVDEDAPPRQVLALAITPTGLLYAGGVFDYAASAYPADTTASGVACWDGTTWTVPGRGVPGTVRALALAADGRVYAGGDFDANQPDWPARRGRVACWDGTAWATIGTSANDTGTDPEQGVAGVVYALAITPTGTLYAAGASLGITEQNPRAGNVARWNGHTWQFLGNGPYRGTTGTVYTLAVAGTHVYAAGDFQPYWPAGGRERGSRVARWDGRIWSPLDPTQPPLPEHYNTVAALVIAPTGTVYVGGQLTGMDPGRRLVTHYLARWTGQHWDHLPQADAQGLNSDVLAVAVASGGRVYAGGTFSRAGTTVARSLAYWGGSTWTPLPLGCLADSTEFPTIAALAVATDGQLYAGARAYSQGPRACRLARWDGRAWHPLGTGLSDNSPTNLVDVRALVPDPGGGVYVGGSFAKAGGLPTPNVARWTGTAWQALGSGLPGWGITALALAPNGDLYAAGDVDLRDGYSHQLVMRWDGHAWHQVGAFCNEKEWKGVTSGTIQALVLAPDGNLYAGGIFTVVSEAGVNVPARSLARWDGHTWHALTPFQPSLARRDERNEDVYSLAIAPGGELYAAGNFEQLDGVTTRYVARWDGTAWHALGSGLNGPARALACLPGGRVVVGGSFTCFGDGYQAAAHFAVFDPAACQLPSAQPHAPKK